MKSINQMDKEKYAEILNNLYDGIYFVDKDRVITYWNKGAERISGYASEEVIGKSCADSILTHIDCDGNCLCMQGCPLLATMDDGKLRDDTIYMHHKDGHRIPVHVRTSALKDEKGHIIGGIEIFTDVSKQEANELLVKELRKLALLDPLTNLANRRYAEQELESRLSEKKRFGIPFGVLLMDIDFFKKVNDTYGHIAGDEVLCLVAKTFTGNSRPFDLYCRWGGEEFVAVIRNVQEKELLAIAERVRNLVESSYLVHDAKKLSVTISIGATMVQEDDSVDSIIARADTNLYGSKSEGRNRVTLE